MKNSLDDFDLTSPGTARSSTAAPEVLEVEVAANRPSLDPETPEKTPLFDLPLREEPAEARARVFAPLHNPRAPIAPTVPREESRRAEPAPLRSRIAALAADGAFVLLLTAAPLLAATAGPARLLSPRGLWWTAVFALYLSFFASVIPLALFGKTVGMALTGLTARGLPESPSLTTAEASRRWLGTLGAVAGLGVPLLWRRDRSAPSLADRLSGRPLSLED